MQEADGRVIYLSPSASVPFTLYKIMFPFGKHSDTRPSPAFDVRFLVENLTTQLVIGHHPVVTIILQGTSAHFEPCRHFLVRQEAFITE